MKIDYTLPKDVFKDDLNDNLEKGDKIIGELIESEFRVSYQRENNNDSYGGMEDFMSEVLSIDESV